MMLSLKIGWLHRPSLFHAGIGLLCRTYALINEYI